MTTKILIYAALMAVGIIILAALYIRDWKKAKVKEAKRKEGTDG